MELDLNERVPPVRPLSKKSILCAAEHFVGRVAPHCLSEPEPIDLAHVIDEKLFDFGIYVYPVDDKVISDHGSEGFTQYENKELTVGIKERYWDALTGEGSDLYRARTTVGHELGHAVLHRQVLEKMAAANVQDPAAALHRQRRRDMEAFRDPEWQAWMFCGGVLLPREALRMLHGHPLADVSRAFKVSQSMLRSHLRKLKPFGFYEEGGLLVAA